ncbi:MAG TPA: hypothetical protein VIH08_07180, partial [Blastococcus sp.]
SAAARARGGRVPGRGTRTPSRGHFDAASNTGGEVEFTAYVVTTTATPGCARILGRGRVPTARPPSAPGSADPPKG